VSWKALLEKLLGHDTNNIYSISCKAEFVAFTVDSIQTLLNDAGDRKIIDVARLGLVSLTYVNQTKQIIIYA